MEPQSHESLPIVTSLWGDIGRGVAAGAGLATVWIDRHGRGRAAHEPKPDVVVSDLRELLDN